MNNSTVNEFIAEVSSSKIEGLTIYQGDNGTWAWKYYDEVTSESFSCPLTALLDFVEYIIYTSAQ
jgi:hypothetical protein